MSVIRKSFTSAIATTATAGLLSLSAGQAHAFQFNLGDWEGAIDSTITASAAMRVEGTRKFGTTDPTGARHLFKDAGDIYSTPVSLLTDFSLSRGNFGFFTRFSYVYDYKIQDMDCTNCERPNVWPYAAGQAPGVGLFDPINSVFHAGSQVELVDGIADSAQDLAGNRFNILDFFVYGGWDIGDHPLNVRVGKQVINWGESNIQGGGIAQMQNPRDLSKATTPGTDVKETLIPQESVYFNFGITDDISLEAYYTWNWRESTFVGVGTYFSGFDFVGSGYNPDLFFRGIEKWGNNEEPDDSGQWGINLHIVIPEWNYADLGIYWVRSHGFIPHTQLDDGYTPRPDPANPGFMTIAGYEWAYPENQDTYAITLNGEGPLETSFALELNVKKNAYDVRECRNLFGIWAAAPNGGPLSGVPAGAIFGFEAIANPVAGPGASDPMPNCNGPGSRSAELGASDVYVFLMNFTKSGGTDLFGADKLNLVFDASFSWVPELESRDIWDKRNYTPTSPTRQSNEVEDRGHHAGAGPLDQPISDFAWGYTAVAGLEYPNLFWNLTMKPTFIFVHNVEGYSAPYTAGGLVENQRSMIYKLSFDYQSQQSLDLQYVNWLGSAGSSYDRDFVSVVYKYSF